MKPALKDFYFTPIGAAKLKILTIPSADEDAEKWTSQALLVGMPNGAPILEKFGGS